jgi:hypothetical protein
VPQGEPSQAHLNWCLRTLARSKRGFAHAAAGGTETALMPSCSAAAMYTCGGIAASPAAHDRRSSARASAAPIY